MSKKNSDETMATFDVFPFLSIMICVLGCLLMILLSETVLSIGVAKTFAVSPKEIQEVEMKLPHFLVWDGEDIEILPNGDRVSWKEARFNNGDNETPFGELLKRIKKNNREEKKEYIILAVKPSGFMNFREIQELIDGNRIGLGYEPIEQDVNLAVKKVAGPDVR